MPPSLVIIDLEHPQVFCHRASFEDRHQQGQCPAGKASQANVTCCLSQPLPSDGTDGTDLPRSK
jgi:hypothetical protein